MNTVFCHDDNGEFAFLAGVLMEHFIEGSAELRLSLTGLFLKKDTKVSKMFEFSNLKCQISKIFQLNLEKHSMLFQI